MAYSSGGCRSIQLSYGRNQFPASSFQFPASSFEALVRPAGLEPAAYWFEASRSIQLSYGRTSRGSYHRPLLLVLPTAALFFGSSSASVNAAAAHPVAIDEIH